MWCQAEMHRSAGSTPATKWQQSRLAKWAIGRIRRVGPSRSKLHYHANYRVRLWSIVSLLAFAIPVVACSDSGSRDDIPPMETQAECIPRDRAPTMPNTATAYADLCSRLLGEIPIADCGEGVRIPVTVAGSEVFETPVDRFCDNTGFKGECAPGSTLRRQAGRALDGTPRLEVVWVTFCRTTGADPNRTLGSVQMIGHDQETGATCFFESPDALGSQAQKEWVALDEEGLLDGELPSPGHPDFDRAWTPPPSPCSVCHHNDPFIHNPWIDGARLPEDPSQPVLPAIATPESPYWVVGGADWDLRTPHIEGNTCTNCHRIGMGSVDVFDALGVLDVNDIMPPNDPGSEADDFAALRECWQNGPDNTPGCEWVNPPGVYCGVPFGGSGKEGSIDGEGDGPHCPDDFDPSLPCTGVVAETLCVFEGDWYWCEGGAWSQNKG
jgi:hypothetical protein